MRKHWEFVEVYYKTPSTIYYLLILWKYNLGPFEFDSSSFLLSVGCYSSKNKIDPSPNWNTVRTDVVKIGFYFSTIRVFWINYDFLSMKVIQIHLFPDILSLSSLSIRWQVSTYKIKGVEVRHLFFRIFCSPWFFGWTVWDNVSLMKELHVQMSLPFNPVTSLICTIYYFVLIRSIKISSDS